MQFKYLESLFSGFIDPNNTTCYIIYSYIATKKNVYWRQAVEVANHTSSY